MAVFQITSPDGQKYKVNAPENATQEQVFEFAKQQFNSQAQRDPNDMGPGGQGRINAIQQRLTDLQNQPPERPPALARIGRGMLDVGQGIRQKALNWTDPEAAQEYTEQVSRDVDLYEQGMGGDTDWWRIAGSAAPFMATPAGPAGLVGRTAFGAGVGAGAGYSLFDEQNDPTSNALRGAIGGVAGGAASAALPAVIGGVTGALQSGSNVLSSLLRRPNAETVATLLRESGFDISAYPENLQNRILQDAREQMSMSGNFNPEQLRRRADIESVAGEGSAMTGQITRDPSQWTQEQNLQRTEVNLPRVARGEVPSITQRLQTQASAREQYANQLLDDISGMTPEMRPKSNLQASELAIEAIQEQDKAADEVVRGLYDAYRQAGTDVAVPDTRIAQELGNVIEEIGDERIPSPVLKRLKDFGFMDGERTRLLTVNEADKLNRLINNNNPGFGPESLALGRIKQALNESLLDIPAEQAAGSQALLTARQAAAERFAQQRAGQGVAQAIKDVAPDRFFERNVLGGNVRDLVALRDTLTKTESGQTAWNALRTQAFQDIIDRATQQGRKALDGTQLDRAINRVGEDRLNVLFNPDELARIDQLRRATTAMTVEPDFSAVNRSNTSGAMMGMLSRSGVVPGLNVITQPIENRLGQDMLESQIARALRGQGANTAQRDAQQQAFRNQLVQQLGRQPSLGVVPPAYLESQNVQ